MKSFNNWNEYYLPNEINYTSSKYDFTFSDVTILGLEQIISNSLFETKTKINNTHFGHFIFLVAKLKNKSQGLSVWKVCTNIHWSSVIKIVCNKTTNSRTKKLLLCIRRRPFTKIFYLYHFEKYKRIKCGNHYYHAHL